MHNDKNLLQHFTSCITSKYFTFSGRASRPEFWGFILFSLILGYLFKLVDQSIVRLSDYDYLSFGAAAIIELFLIIPRVAVGVRRFHDTGKTGIVPIILAILLTAPSLIAYISLLFPTKILNIGPFLGLTSYSSFLLVLVPLALYYLYVAAQRGDVGLNKYGPDPLNPELGNEIDQIGEE